MLLPAANFWNVLFIAGLGLLVVVWLTAYAYSLFWSYGDARARGKSGLRVALLVALLKWPVGLLMWLFFRPNRPDADRGCSSRCS